MKRKRFVKLLMSRGWDRNSAECIARNIRAMGLDYFGYYHGTNLNKYEWKVRHDRS